MPLLDRRAVEIQRDRRDPPPVNGRAQEDVLRRAQLLLDRDRTLVELALRNNASHRQLARTLNTTCGTITRRLHRLGARLHDPLVIALLREDCPVKPELRQVGVEHLLQGLTLRQIADRHRMTISEVRRILTYLRGWHSAARTG